MHSYELMFEFSLQTSQPHPQRGPKKVLQLPREAEAMEDDKQTFPDDAAAAVRYITLHIR